MSAAKLSKKELKEDEFLSTFERVLRHLSLHPKRYLGLGSVVLLLLVALSFSLTYLERNESKARLTLSKANQVYRENLALLDQNSPYERRGIPDFEKPLKLYQDVIEQFPRTRAATEALYQSARCLHHLSRWGEAIEAYTRYLQRSPRGEFSLLAALGLGNCYEQKGELDKAAEVYSTALHRQGNDPLRGELMVSLGRCQEALGKKEEAIRTYREIGEKFPNSIWKSYADRKLLYLKGR
jgi:TolA-binding protein